MALGNKILITSQPRGVFIEGILTGTPKPGTAMQIDVSEAEVNGRWTWEVYNQSADAESGLIAILLEDSNQGRLTTTAYVAADRVRMYCPLPGEEMNILIQDVAGTADDHAIGERLIVDDGTGTFLATTGTGFTKSEPFVLLETITDPAADTLARAIFTGY